MRRGKGLLTPIQRAFLSAFAGLPDQAHFYLAGGTALAEYYLGHRLSLDLEVDKLLAYYGRAEPRDAVDLYFILQRASLDELLTLAAEKDPGFDLYWFAVALNRSAGFPDELERWPVKMLQPLEPTELKQQFQRLALQLLARVTNE